MDAGLQTAGHSFGSHAMLDVSDEMDAAYRATTYTVYLPSGNGETKNLELRVGHHSAALDQLLDHHHCDEWAFISAANPGSRRLPEAVNAERYRQLHDTVCQLNLPYFAGSGIPDMPGWPAEPSLMVLGISLNQAQNIASHFGQRAILAGIRGSTPTLHYGKT
jgi:hypothetical protein